MLKPILLNKKASHLKGTLPPRCGGLIFPLCKGELIFRQPWECTFCRSSRFGLVLLCLFLGIFFSGCEKTAQKTMIEVGSTRFEVEVADTESERVVGLMNRDSLPKGHGMWFVFPQSQKQGFWMKHTRIPLDIVWISESMEVVALSRSTPPCDEVTSQKDLCPMYIPEESARYVLEVNAGEFNGQRGSLIKLIQE